MAAAAFAMSMPFALQGAAAAQEAGSYRSAHSYVRDYVTIDHAGLAFTGGTLVGTSTVLESSGPPFAKGETRVGRCVVFARSSRDGAVDLESPCMLSDGAGDEIYLLARRQAGDMAEGGGGAGRFEIMGGTGKYADVSGECDYVTRYLPAGHVEVSSECTWRRP